MTINDKYWFELFTYLFISVYRTICSIVNQLLSVVQNLWIMVYQFHDGIYVHLKWIWQEKQRNLFCRTYFFLLKCNTQIKSEHDLHNEGHLNSNREMTIRPIIFFSKSEQYMLIWILEVFPLCNFIQFSQRWSEKLNNSAYYI